MRAPTTKEERKLRDADFERRMLPRPVWNANAGTAMRVRDRDGRKALPPSYHVMPAVEKKKFKPTEAQDNALGRAERRRTNRKLRGWRPYAQR